jgi:hypothetical protein
MTHKFRWFSEYPEYSEISVADKAVRDKIVAIIDQYTRDMEGYSYFGSNYGVPKDDYEEIADQIMVEFGIKG